MDTGPSIDAWNNFVMNSRASAYEPGSIRRAAAIANLFMALANNGGLNAFLTESYDLDASEVLEALTSVGAFFAAKQLGMVLRGLHATLSVSSQEVRWALMDERWSDSLDVYETLSEEADRELMQVLGRHVAENEVFYLALK
jgi:hypothetical protein